MAEIIDSTGNVPFLGMNLSSNMLALKPGQASYILNGVPKSGVCKNARSTKKAITLTPGFKYISSCTLTGTTKLIFSKHPSTTVCEIGIFDSLQNTYTTVIASKLFNFQLTKPITGKVKIAYNGNRIVYFTDGFNLRRRLDLDNIPFVNGDIDIDSINVDSKYNIPQIKIEKVVDNGALQSGSYFVFGQYADANGNGLTSMFTPVGAIPITRNGNSDSYAFIEGIASGQPTNKAIVVSFNNLDTSFDHYNVGIVRVVGGVKRAFIINTFPTSQSKIIINGQGNAPIEIPLSDLATSNNIYTTAGTLEQCGDILIWGDLKAKKQPNLQPFFNKLRVEWQVSRHRCDDNEANHVNPINSVYKKVLRSGEVYGIGIVIRWNNGSKSSVFHIPNRELNKSNDGSLITSVRDQYGANVPSGQWDGFSNYVGPDAIAGEPRWKQFNTAFVKGTELVGAEGPAEYGEFGYYESTNLYPNNKAVWGDLAGKPIRFHRAPDSSIIHIHDQGGNNGIDKNPYLNFLGFRFNNIEQVIASLPKEVRDEMQGYEVVITDRAFNKSVIASGILYNTLFNNWKTQDWGTDDVRLYSNYPFNDLRPDVYHNKKAIGNIKASGLNDRYRNDVFTFVSPDTSFKKTALSNSRFLIHGEVYGTCRSYWKYLSPYPKFFDRNNSDDDDCGSQVIALGWYNNFSKSRYGNISRKIKEAMYVPFNVQVSTGNIGSVLHNVGRESTVVIGFTDPLANTVNADTSRAIQHQSDVGCVRERPFTRSISAHYGSIFSFIENQYGSIFDIRYRYTNYDSYNVKNNSLIFGGDTFIGRFAIKRQLPFYSYAQQYITTSDGSKSIKFNFGTNLPGYGYNYNSDSNNARKISTLLCGTGSELGQLPLIYSSVPIIYTEADDNLNLRLNGELPFETFYQNLLNGGVQLDEYLGVKHIDKDNYCVINSDYSQSNDLSIYDNGSPFYDPTDTDDVDFYGRVIYSLPSSAEDIFDNWRIYLPRNYYDFPKTEGRIIDIRYIGQYRTIFRLENGTFIDQLYTSMETTENTISLGSGKLFSKKPEKIVTADNINVGTNHSLDFVNTPFGAFMACAELGEVYQFGTNLQTISSNDAQTWFNENLPFKLNKQISMKGEHQLTAASGIGLIGTFDYEHKLYILTKKDYELVNIENRFRYKYENGKFYFDDKEVQLTDSVHFKDLSFTISYSPLTNLWYSFYSFLPDFYISLGLKVYSGQNIEADVDINSHDGSTFTTFYGKKYPHIIDMPLAAEGLMDRTAMWFGFITKCYSDLGDDRKGEQRYKTFSKAILYNNYQCSGELRFKVKDPLKLSTFFSTLKNGNNYREIELKRSGSMFAFSGIYDLYKKSAFGSLGFFTRDWAIRKDYPYLDKVLDHSALDYKRDYKEMLAISDLHINCRYFYEDNESELSTYLINIVDKKFII